MLRITLFFLVFVHGLFAQKSQTVTYFSNDTLKLEMDIYLPHTVGKKPLPVVLHMHGGGFAQGDRKQEDAYCRFLAQNGIVSASMSYTLYAKGKKFSCDGLLTEKVRAFQHAVSNLWLATAYLLENQKTLQIDPQRIFTSGISAGAEAILHGAYWDQNTMQIYPKFLPKDFKYAGIISGAGALLDVNLITKKSVVPMLLFHGSEDVTVPYGIAPHHLCPPTSSGYMMLFGSYPIYQRAMQLESTVELFTYCGGNHGYSGYLILQEPQYIVDFIYSVCQNKKWQTHRIFNAGNPGKITASYEFCQ